MLHPTHLETCTATAKAAARRLTLAGRVQGLGVRPTIYLLADELQLVGMVRNTSCGVEIVVEGPEESLLEFEALLPIRLPDAVLLERFDVQTIEPSGYEQFTIVREPSDGPLAARIPEDRAVCHECLAEVADPKDRRFGYPFTSCTLCGPRYSIIHSMPYERSDTAMDAFAFCESCRSEYEQPGNRRLHAQTNACADCGPKAWFVSVVGCRLSATGGAALEAAVELLKAGGIVALRGLGGYQLLADATDERAVAKLRQRKHRHGKPLAVLVDSLETAERLAVLDEAERAAIMDPINPIVLLQARAGSSLAAGVHPHLDTVGLLLPTTPLHALLAKQFGRPLVCTSANREGEPLEYEVEGAEKNLAGLCDGWLHHDRPIAHPIDDSVVRIIAGRRVTIRLARGLAPLTLNLPALDLPQAKPTLAVGGHQKLAAAWSNGAQAVLGPHLGDMETLAARQRFEQQLGDWQSLYQFQPKRYACDAHPDYFTTHWTGVSSSPRGERLGEGLEKKATVETVQHHHAHVVAGMLEQGWLDRQVLGVAWDGTGYGTDGTIWGGEFLLATATNFEQFARLRPFCLPGGEAAIRQPWRTALAILSQVLSKESLAKSPLLDTDSGERRQVLQLLDKPAFSPATTSAGRLFDAAAVIALDLDEAQFEGQPAMRLEAAADRQATGEYAFPVHEAGSLLELDWRPLFADLLADRAAGASPGAMAIRFHRSLASGIAQICRRRDDLPVVFSGGVFQSRLLTELVVEQLAGHPQPLGLPGVIPPNDGGLAAGQLAVAIMRQVTTKQENPPCV